MHFYLLKICALARTDDSVYTSTHSQSTPLGRRMMDWPSFVLSLLLGFLFLLLSFYFVLHSRPSLFPPGPPNLPLLGAYPFLSGNGPEKYFGPEVRESNTESFEKGESHNFQVCSFGPITGLYAGSYPTIVLNDWPLAKSLFAKEEFCGRLK